jgi:hypothetical protein
MVTYPKLVKPWRGYPSSNTIMAIRARIDQAPVIDTTGATTLGTSALTVGKPFHVGTIPIGSFVLPGFAHVRTAFTGTLPALKIGTQLDDDGLMVAADVPLGTAAVKTGLVGAQSGFALIQYEVWAILTGTGITAGAVDWVCPFYIQKD